MNNDAPFPDLRYAYLRAVARAWNDPAFLDVLVAESERGNGLAFLEQTYNFEFAYDIKFSMAAGDHRPIWEPGAPSGWFGFRDRFTVALPAKPEDPADSADILARYSFEFPTLLGKSPEPGPADFAEFGVVTSRLIALAWANRDFFDALLHPERYYTDTVFLIQDAMDYMVPWNFRMHFIEAPGDASTSDEYWAAFPRSEIIVNVPLPPDDPAVQPVALAAYNGTGGMYPFSCG